MTTAAKSAVAGTGEASTDITAGAAARAAAVNEPACDAHIHIYTPGFPSSGPIPANAGVPHYREVQKRLGLTRAVVVQPRLYGTDNRATLHAIEELGIDHTRGIAVINEAVSDADLVKLHEGGIRGIRFSFHAPNAEAGDFGTVSRLAKRIAFLGWHVQLHWTAEQIVQHADLLKSLPTTMVFDHMGRLPLPDGPSHPAADIVRDLLTSGRAWLKLSGPYLNTAGGVAGGYHDTDAIAQYWLDAAPQQLVWGSDWPHITEMEHKPDALELRALLSRWCPSPSLQHQILVDNPARLYGFFKP